VPIDGVELVLAPPDDHDVEWIDFDACVLRLAAAWLRFSPKEPPLTPRIIGEPGVGKTTLACAVAHRLGRPPYIFQCTMDTRPEEFVRHAHHAEYEGLPDAKGGEKYHWGAYPPDEAEWESFVGYLLRRASIQDPGEARAVPFTARLADGVDVRATIRFWHQGHIYVREEQRGLLNVRNGAIDWSGDEEDSDVLSGRAGGGWNDPDSPRVGSASRETEHYELLQQAGHSEVTRRRREWSLMSLDLPTFKPERPGSFRPAADTFFDKVIEPLLAIQGRPGRDHVYGWLEAMFRFCAGKPFAYYSRYHPSPRIFALARKHGVALRWQPLGFVPAALLIRNRTFRQIRLSASQWAALGSRLGLGRSA
jgi:hypothetical protein